MRADDRQARESPQQRDKAVWVGEVIAAVSRVQEQGQNALALLRQRKAARIVEAEALDVRMQLHAVQAQSAQVGDILLQRRRIGVQRTEAVQAVRKLRDLAGDLCRVNVAVGVKNLHHRRSSTATR